MSLSDVVVLYQVRKSSDKFFLSTQENFDLFSENTPVII